LPIKLENRKLRICFVSLSSYPLLTETHLEYIGGAELQQVVLAKELKRRGYRISFITYGKNSDEIKKVNGIEIVPTYDRNEVNNLSFLRKALCLWKKMKEVDADIYFLRAGSPGIASIFGKLHKKKIINFIASDSQVSGEVITKRSAITGFLIKIGNWFDIKLSTIVISQNNFQKSKLKNRFKVNSIIIRNALNIPPQTDNHKPVYILWVGTIRSVKQPTLFLNIAKHFSRYKFLMIGGKSEDTELFRETNNAVNKIQNLDFMGFVPHNKIFDYYKKAILLINTSKTEGFPNVFLETWAHSIPVISLNVDPDGVISRYKLGYHSKSFEKMIEDIRALMENKTLRKKMGENGRKYIEKYHDIKKVVDKCENVIKNLSRNEPKIRNKINLYEE